MKQKQKIKCCNVLYTSETKERGHAVFGPLVVDDEICNMNS